MAEVWDLDAMQFTDLLDNLVRVDHPFLLEHRMLKVSSGNEEHLLASSEGVLLVAQRLWEKAR